jgi:Cu2+-exporting ATPase
MADLDLSAFVRRRNDGLSEIAFVVPDAHCGACVGRIERGLKAVEGIVEARLNLSTRRLTVVWAESALAAARLPEVISGLGYSAQPFALSRLEADDAQEGRGLLRALAVAFFGAMNIMLLSVSVWSGNATDITPETRDLFHWFSALIALPVAAYAGRPFFRSAWSALRLRRVNMDVPISLGVILALALSLYETWHGATHAYFDSAIMLLFFLLLGRTLDRMMRRRARGYAANLMAMRGETALRLGSDGVPVESPVAALQSGDEILVRPGDRVGSDGIVIAGTSEVDQSFATGETRAVAASAGCQVYAGSLNLTGTLTVRVARAAEGDLLEQVDRLLTSALAVKDRRVMLADRAARAYAPFVHTAAALTLVGWLFAGSSLHHAVVTAIAVLIITCPCALGLAIPAVQVVATGALFRKGVLIQSGDALERMAACDLVVFDKTGTLTSPDMQLVHDGSRPPDLAAAAARLALSSRHPVASALARRYPQARPCSEASEVPGEGVEANIDGLVARLGRPSFVGLAAEAEAALAREPGATALAFRWGERGTIFLVKQQLRPGARAVVDGLRAAGCEVSILSGDGEAPVAAVAAELGVTEWRARCMPADKIAVLERHAAQGRRVLMIGDGINDAPSLAAAHASLSPANSAHLAQAAADALFLGESLEPVLSTVRLSHRARRLMTQNLWLSVIYNVMAVPIAVAGYVTPLVAAAAMSGSSILVTLNALRAGDFRLAHRSGGAFPSDAAQGVNPSAAKPVVPA